MSPNHWLPFAAACMATVQLLAAPPKIACIGDSITEGTGLSNPAVESYPGKLQRVLGTNYAVRNFGVSGRTLLKKGDYPYWRESAYQQSRDYAPDIVTIMLGTNDSKPQNWRYETNFVADYSELIASYTNLSSHPRVMLCTPCPVYGVGAYDIRPGVVANAIAPAVRQLAALYGLEVIELNLLMAGHQEWFPDTVHPNSSGTTVMAVWFRNALLGDSGSPEPPALALNRISTSRSVLTWPADHAGWVLMTRSLLRTNSSWSVAVEPAYNDSSRLSVTNVSSASQRYYRLWKP